MKGVIMSDRSNLAIGAGVGAAAGTGAGYAVAAKKAKEILKPFLGKDGKPSVDVYVANRVAANEDGILGTVRESKINKALERVVEKAKQDFEPLLAKAQGLVKNTKIKYAAIGLAAGAAVGLATTAIVKKVKASKAQKAQ